MLRTQLSVLANELDELKSVLEVRQPRATIKTHLRVTGKVDDGTQKPSTDFFKHGTINDSLALDMLNYLPWRNVAALCEVRAIRGEKSTCKKAIFWRSVLSLQYGLDFSDKSGMKFRSPLSNELNFKALKILFSDLTGDELVSGLITLTKACDEGVPRQARRRTEGTYDGMVFESEVGSDVEYATPIVVYLMQSQASTFGKKKVDNLKKLILEDTLTEDKMRSVAINDQSVYFVSVQPGEIEIRDVATDKVLHTLQNVSFAEAILTYWFFYAKKSKKAFAVDVLGMGIAEFDLKSGKMTEYETRARDDVSNVRIIYDDAGEPQKIEFAGQFTKISGVFDQKYFATRTRNHLWFVGNRPTESQMNRRFMGNGKFWLSWTTAPSEYGGMAATVTKTDGENKFHLGINGRMTSTNFPSRKRFGLAPILLRNSVAFFNSLDATLFIAAGKGFLSPYPTKKAYEMLPKLFAKRLVTMALYQANAPRDLDEKLTRLEGGETPQAIVSFEELVDELQLSVTQTKQLRRV